MSFNNYTEDQLILQALQEAVPRLAQTRDEWAVGKKEEFICHAIKTCWSYPGAESARELINQRLQNFATVNNWLIANVPAARELSEKDYMKFEEQVQRYRHRWLKSLIKEFKERVREC